MRRFQLPAFAIVAGGLLVILGCNNRTVNTAEMTADGRWKWVETDSSLAKSVALIGATRGKADDLLRIQVEVRNLTNSPQRYYYRVEWFDDQNFEVNSPLSTWQVRTLQGGESQRINGVAPNPRVTDVRVKLQESNRN